LQLRGAECFGEEHGHGSYPDTGEEPACSDGGTGLLEDNRADGGNVWETWKHMFAAKDQPWYGFGGAWGAVAQGGVLPAERTGPLGPSVHKEFLGHGWGTPEPSSPLRWLAPSL
jgi:hypothetical protein